ncbi:MAG: chorismate mutase [Hyphomicrobiales bacterium]
MRSPIAEPRTLEDARHEIDRVDSGILELIAKRLALVDRVRALKSDTGTSSPLRPAREAIVIRRIMEEAGTEVPQDLCLRIWRSLISAATQRQAAVHVHAPGSLIASAGHKLLVCEYFASAELVAHPDEYAALSAVKEKAGDIAAVALESHWVSPFLHGAAGSALVIGSLPFLSRGRPPRVLIWSQAPAEPSGDDETLIVAQSPPSAWSHLRAKWQLDAGEKTLLCLAGFLPDAELGRSGIAHTVVGRYPSPIVVRS